MDFNDDDDLRKNYESKGVRELLAMMKEKKILVKGCIMKDDLIDKLLKGERRGKRKRLDNIHETKMKKSRKSESLQHDQEESHLSRESVHKDDYKDQDGSLPKGNDDLEDQDESLSKESASKEHLMEQDEDLPSESEDHAEDQKESSTADPPHMKIILEGTNHNAFSNTFCSSVPTRDDLLRESVARERARDRDVSSENMHKDDLDDQEECLPREGTSENDFPDPDESSPIKNMSEYQEKGLVRESASEDDLGDQDGGASGNVSEDEKTESDSPSVKKETDKRTKDKRKKDRKKKKKKKKKKKSNIKQKLRVYRKGQLVTCRHNNEERLAVVQSQDERNSKQFIVATWMEKEGQFKKMKKLRKNLTKLKSQSKPYLWGFLASPTKFLATRTKLLKLIDLDKVLFKISFDNLPSDAYKCWEELNKIGHAIDDLSKQLRSNGDCPDLPELFIKSELMRRIGLFKGILSVESNPRLKGALKVVGQRYGPQEVVGQKYDGIYVLIDGCLDGLLAFKKKGEDSIFHRHRGCWYITDFHRGDQYKIKNWEVERITDMRNNEYRNKDISVEFLPLVQNSEFKPCRIPIWIEYDGGYWPGRVLSAQEIAEQVWSEYPEDVEGEGYICVNYFDRGNTADWKTSKDLQHWPQMDFDSMVSQAVSYGESPEYKLLKKLSSKGSIRDRDLQDLQLGIIRAKQQMLKECLSNDLSKEHIVENKNENHSTRQQGSKLETKYSNLGHKLRRCVVDVEALKSALIKRKPERILELSENLSRIFEEFFNDAHRVCIESSQKVEGGSAFLLIQKETENHGQGIDSDSILVEELTMARKLEEFLAGKHIRLHKVCIEKRRRTRGEILEDIRQYFNHREGDHEQKWTGVKMLFYSGHGLEDTGDWKLCDDHPITLDEIIDVFGRSHAFQTGCKLYINSDCCHSGFWVEQAKNWMRNANFLPRKKLKVLQNVAIQASCQHDQNALDGLFMKQWIQYQSQPVLGNQFQSPFELKLEHLNELKAHDANDPMKPSACAGWGNSTDHSPLPLMIKRKSLIKDENSDDKMFSHSWFWLKFL